jgi:phosphoribosylglycinamide formyltransferase-1
VVSNKADAKGLVFARAHGIATAVLDHKAFASREAFDAELAPRLTATSPRWWCWPGSCASSRRVLWRITPGGSSTSTPRCCPLSPGLHTHQRAIDAGCKFAGVTVHQVTAELDVGPILDQAVVPVLPGDTAQTPWPRAC